LLPFTAVRTFTDCILYKHKMRLFCSLSHCSFYSYRLRRFLWS